MIFRTIPSTERIKWRNKYLMISKYCYIDIDVTIDEALQMANVYLASLYERKDMPTFTVFVRWSAQPLL